MPRMPRVPGTHEHLCRWRDSDGARPHSAASFHAVDPGLGGNVVGQPHPGQTRRRQVRYCWRLAPPFLRRPRSPDRRQCDSVDVPGESLEATAASGRLPPGQPVHDPLDRGRRPVPVRVELRQPRQRRVHPAQWRHQPPIVLVPVAAQLARPLHLPGHGPRIHRGKHRGFRPVSAVASPGLAFSASVIPTTSGPPSGCSFSETGSACRTMAPSHSASSAPSPFWP
jgi:hypothetical protein